MGRKEKCGFRGLLSSGPEDQGAEVVPLRARRRPSGPAIFVVEAAEVALPLLFLVEVPDREIEPEARFAQRRAPDNAELPDKKIPPPFRAGGFPFSLN
jgi:hypothetical protein